MSAAGRNAGDATTRAPVADTSADDAPQSRRAAWPYALAAALALVGLVDALYLTAKHYEGGTVRCTVVSGCNEVLSSEYSAVGGVPVALLGAVAYFTAFSLATLSAFNYRATRPALALLAALMLCASLWFLYVQTFLLGQFCSFCLLSAAVNVTIAATVAAGRLWKR